MFPPELTLGVINKTLKWLLERCHYVSDKVELQTHQRLGKGLIRYEGVKGNPETPVTLPIMYDSTIFFIVRWTL